MVICGWNLLKKVSAPNPSETSETFFFGDADDVFADTSKFASGLILTGSGSNTHSQLRLYRSVMGPGEVPFQHGLFAELRALAPFETPFMCSGATRETLCVTTSNRILISGGSFVASLILAPELSALPPEEAANTDAYQLGTAVQIPMPRAMLDGETIVDISIGS